MKLNSFEKKILSFTFKASEGLFIHTIFQRLNITPKELFVSINKLVELELIYNIDDRLTITKAGTDFALNNNIKSGDKENKANKIPEQFLGPKIEINAFYIPKLPRNQDLV